MYARPTWSSSFNIGRLHTIMAPCIIIIIIVIIDSKFLWSSRARVDSNRYRLHMLIAGDLASSRANRSTYHGYRVPISSGSARPRIGQKSFICSADVLIVFSTLKIAKSCDSSKSYVESSRLWPPSDWLSFIFFFWIYWFHSQLIIIEFESQVLFHSTMLSFRLRISLKHLITAFLHTKYRFTLLVNRNLIVKRKPPAPLTTVDITWNVRKIMKSIPKSHIMWT